MFRINEGTMSKCLATSTIFVFTFTFPTKSWQGNGKLESYWKWNRLKETERKGGSLGENKRDGCAYIPY